MERKKSVQRFIDIKPAESPSYSPSIFPFLTPTTTPSSSPLINRMEVVRTDCLNKPCPAPIGAIPPMDYIIPPTPKAPESTYSANDDGATLELNTAAAPG